MRDRLDHFPLRQVVGIDCAQERVAGRRGTLDWLSRSGRYQVAGHGAGAMILAAGEFALAEAQVVLRQACGDALRFGSVAVHTYADDEGRVMAPVMFLRIDTPRAHGRGLLRLLNDRSIAPREVEVQRARTLIRAEAPLARLLGVERAIGEFTDGSAHTMCWLLRYDAAAPEPQDTQLKELAALTSPLPL
ncbi:MAG: hypothetical protein EOO24_17525 [Comamonadaceae bacterium]|nr:MAG: hypothetical protein EOO24_17525 [Comamonadaceae bacterium]